MNVSNKRPNPGQPLEIAKRYKDSKSELQSLITPSMDCNKENVPANNSATTSSSSSSELTSLKIVNFNHLFQQFASITSHSTNNCQPKHIQFIKETPQGPLSSTISFKCQNCNYESTITTNPNPPAICNNLLVESCLNSSIDCRQLNRFCSTLDIAQKISHDEFRQNELTILKAMRINVWNTMHDAAQEEAALARKEGSLAASGHPLITVIVDTSDNYNYVAIFGKRTGKILFFGAKNLFCTICLRAQVLGEEPYKYHKCFKDLESFPRDTMNSLICEGFQYSIQMYGLIYSQLMNDVDDNEIYNELRYQSPYGEDNPIPPVKLPNQVINDYISELKKLTRSNENVLPMMIEALKANIWKFRSAVSETVQHLRWKKLDPDIKSEMLRNSILNIPSHVLGEHEKCLELEGKCKKPYVKTELVSTMKKCGYFDQIVACSQILLDNLATLLQSYYNVLDDFGREFCYYVKHGVDSLECEANCFYLVVNYNKNCKSDSQIPLIKQKDESDDGREKKPLRDYYQATTENGETVEIKLEVDDVKLI